jgi:hypothetical protein
MILCKIRYVYQKVIIILILDWCILLRYIVRNLFLKLLLLKASHETGSMPLSTPHFVKWLYEKPRQKITALF